ncbi:glycosyltransferase [Rhodobacterales bacterium HKCCE2091]|nr:glycosyltransferase [Rhodobacterales bacterium HKCCE2091]
MTASAPCLDVTRLVTRAGAGPLTGIDRIELSWLEHLARNPNSRFLLRSTRGYLLLGSEGAGVLASMARGLVQPGEADLISRLTGRGGRMRHRVEAALRPHARARCLPQGFARLARRELSGGKYLNVGHANFGRRVLSGLRGAGVRIGVLVHDTIPLDHPDYVAPGATARFAGFLDRAAKADVLAVPTRAVAADVRRHLPGVSPVVAPPGVEPATPDPRNAPRGRPPYFICVGTIEPRKNHALLLDAWEMMADTGDPPPEMHIVGRRGWHDPAFFARLDDHPLRGDRIHVHDGLPDGHAQALLEGAAALLMPSFAEGYGLPPLEALAAGVPALVSDLPVFRETLGFSGVYLDPMDAYPWTKRIRRIAAGLDPRPMAPLAVPDRAGHIAAITHALRGTEGRG